MIVLKIIFAVMVCVPIAALAYYLFESITEDVAYGTRRVPLEKKKGLTGKFFKMISEGKEKRRAKREAKKDKQQETQAEDHKEESE